jgi:outer membrane lipopolysaccharide assembly protein LptE/RlpB
MIDTMRRRLFAALVLAPLALVPLSGCGYSLAGRGSALPAHIRTIGVPLFTNATSVFDVEQTLTARVRLEFIGRGRYKVVPEGTGTDAVLKGDITGISVRPTAFDSNQQASRYEITVVVKVEFRDIVNDKVLYENPAQTFKEEYEVTTGQSASDPRTFLGQNSNALERLSVDFAKTVVSAVLEAF